MPHQKQNWSQRSKTHSLYNQDINQVSDNRQHQKKMEHAQTYCYICSDDRYISQYTVYFVSSFRNIYEFYFVWDVWYSLSFVYQ